MSEHLRVDLLLCDAYGYCAEARDTVDRASFTTEEAPAEASSGSGGGDHTWVYIAAAGVVALGLFLFLRRRQVVRRRAGR